MDTVPEYYNLVEGEAGLRALPVNEFVDGVPVAALGIRTRQAIEHGGLGVVKIGQAKNCLRNPAFLIW